MGSPLPIDVEVLEHGRGLPLPAYESEGAAGMDLRAAVGAPLVIPVGGRVLVPTGLSIAVPRGYEAQVRARSGLALRQGLVVPNAPGTIDSDYRGEVKVILQNLGEAEVTVERGMRIAQLIFAPVTRASWRVSSDLDATTRGAGGFGHTGSA